MKRIITAIVLTVFLFAVAYIGRWIATDSIRAVQETMEQIDTDLAEGNKEIALQRSEEFLKEWDVHHGRMCLFLQHDHLDPLESTFALLPYYIEQDEIILARAGCKNVCTVTEHILKTEQISLENIL